MWILLYFLFLHLSEREPVNAHRYLVRWPVWRRNGHSYPAPSAKKEEKAFTKKLNWKLRLFLRELRRVKCMESTERTLNLHRKLPVQEDVIWAIHHAIWNVRSGGLGSVQGGFLVSVVIENKDLLTEVKEPQNVPLEGGGTAQRDLQGLATLGLIWWVINPCAVLWWILTTSHLSCIFWKSENNPPFRTLFSCGTGSAGKGNTCQLKIHPSEAFKWSSVSARL